MLLTCSLTGMQRAAAWSCQEHGQLDGQRGSSSADTRHSSLCGSWSRQSCTAGSSSQKRNQLGQNPPQEGMWGPGQSSQAGTQLCRECLSLRLEAEGSRAHSHVWSALVRSAGAGGRGKGGGGSLKQPHAATPEARTAGCSST